MGKVPETVIIGLKPAEMKICSIDLTDKTEAKTHTVVEMVLTELDRLGIWYKKGWEKDVPGNSVENR